MRQSVMIMLLVAGCGGLVACGPPVKPDISNKQTDSAGAQGAGNGPNAGGVNLADEEVAGPQDGMLLKRTIYFDFDSAEIRGEGMEIVAAHAKYLASHGPARVRLEGNTDERGSREYNIGLGERRAQAVARALRLQGAANVQLSTVSYGEERPAVPGHDESAWAKDRRVEIVYTTPGMNLPGASP
jgi:peptidoglycan-associated lipoprotein